MRRSFGPRLIAAFVLACFGCSFLVDTSDLTCPSGFKSCQDFGCVRLDDPAHGCANPDLCSACPLASGIVTCEAGQCATKSCLEGFDCNCGVSGVNVYTDEQNCGECGKACDDGQICSIGVCVTPITRQ